eukprot:7808105-Heterocapsa_arctica.AAC.1
MERRLDVLGRATQHRPVGLRGVLKDHEDFDVFAERLITLADVLDAQSLPVGDALGKVEVLRAIRFPAVLGHAPCLETVVLASQAYHADGLAVRAADEEVPQRLGDVLVRLVHLMQCDGH